jgi:hypothetical protein
MEIDLGYAPVAVLLESRDYAIATISEEDYEQRATGVGLRPGPLWVRFGPRPVKTLFLEKRAHLEWIYPSGKSTVVQNGPKFPKIWNGWSLDRVFTRSGS